MIGSCTLVVKDRNSYRVHIIGLVLGEVKAAELIDIDERYRNKPDGDNLSESDVYSILSSRQCASENQPNYSKFAGDRKWFVDLTSKKLLSIENFIKRWESANKKALEQAEKVRVTALQEKTKRLVKEVKANALVFAKELVAVMEGTSKLKPTDAGHSGLHALKFEINHFSFSQWATDRLRVQFFAPAYSEDRDLIAKHFSEDFFPKFLKKRGYRVTVMKTPDWQKKMRVSAFFAKKNGRTLHWSQRMESDLSLVELTPL